MKNKNYFIFSRIIASILLFLGVVFLEKSYVFMYISAIALPLVFIIDPLFNKLYRKNDWFFNKIKIVKTQKLDAIIPIIPSKIFLFL